MRYSFRPRAAPMRTVERLVFAGGVPTIQLGLATTTLLVGLATASVAQPDPDAGKTAFSLLDQCEKREASCYAYLTGVYDTMLAVRAAGSATKDIICPPKDAISPVALADKYLQWIMAYPSLLGIPMSEAAYLAIVEAYACPGP